MRFVRAHSILNMRTLILFITIFCVNSCHSQDINNIFGKWRVIVMDNGVRYDYKTGEYIISKKLKDSLSKQKDNLFTLDDYINGSKSCSDCYFLFTKEGVYQELRGDMLRTEGTFQQSLKDSTLKIVIKAKDEDISKSYKYFFTNSRLVLSVPSFWTKENYTIELEKID